MPLATDVLQEHIQKAHNFPGHLLKSIARSEAPYLCDLHGYTCKGARELLQEAFCRPLPHPAVYTFLLGRGRHSVKQYRIQLQKACHDGLRAAGLAEDRHASDEAVGKFKSIADNDHGMHMVRVFPFVSSCRSAEAPAASKPPEVDELEAELSVKIVHERGSQADLARLSVLGLAEFLSELLPILLAGLRGKVALRTNESCTALESHAFDVLEDLQQSWKAGLDLLRDSLVQTGELTQEEHTACRLLLESMKSSPQSYRSNRAEIELFSLVENCGILKRPSSRNSMAALKKMKKEFSKIDTTLQRWKAGKHMFENVQAQKATLDRADTLREQIAEFHQQLHAAARLKSPTEASAEVMAKNTCVQLTEQEPSKKDKKRAEAEKMERLTAEKMRAEEEEQHSRHSIEVKLAEEDAELQQMLAEANEQTKDGQKQRLSLKAAAAEIKARSRAKTLARRQGMMLEELQQHEGGHETAHDDPTMASCMSAQIAEAAEIDEVRSTTSHQCTEDTAAWTGTAEASSTSCSEAQEKAVGEEMCSQDCGAKVDGKTYEDPGSRRRWARRVVRPVPDVCIALCQYTAEAQGYLSVVPGDVVFLASCGKFPGDPGSAYASYVFGKQRKNDLEGWLPLAVLWERYLDHTGRPWLFNPETGRWRWEEAGSNCCFGS